MGWGEGEDDHIWFFLDSKCSSKNALFFNFVDLLPGPDDKLLGIPYLGSYFDHWIIKIILYHFSLASAKLVQAVYNYMHLFGVAPRSKPLFLVGVNRADITHF